MSDGGVVPVSLSEEDLGRLFLRAQAYADGAVTAAEAEAHEIVARARQEAAAILDAARRASVVASADAAEVERLKEQLREVSEAMAALQERLSRPPQ